MKFPTWSHNLACLIFFVLLISVNTRLNADGRDEDGARALYKTAVDLGRSYAGIGDGRKQAAEIAETIKLRYPKSAYSELTLIMLESLRYDMYRESDEAAVWSLVERLNAMPDDVGDKYVILAELKLNYGPDGSAAELAKKALAIDATNADAMALLARAESKAHHYDVAEQWYRRSIEGQGSPDRKSNLYHGLGLMFAGETGMSPPKNDMANEAMAMSVHLSPDAPWKIGDYAHFLNCRMNDYELAEKHARRALEIMEYGMARRELGIALYGQWALTYVATPPGEAIAKAWERFEAIQQETGYNSNDALNYFKANNCDQRVVDAFLAGGL